MTLVDRFVCRREGHLPAVTITRSTFTVSAYCKCVRCGEWTEAATPDQAGAEDPVPLKKAGERSDA